MQHKHKSSAKLIAYRKLEKNLLLAQQRHLVLFCFLLMAYCCILCFWHVQLKNCNCMQSTVSSSEIVCYGYTCAVGLQITLIGNRRSRPTPEMNMATVKAGNHNILCFITSWQEIPAATLFSGLPEVHIDTHRRWPAVAILYFPYMERIRCLSHWDSRPEERYNRQSSHLSFT